MNWHLLTHHDWQVPLEFAARFAQERAFAFLYSGRSEAATGQRSFLFLEPAFQHTGSQWADLPAAMGEGNLPDWVGYLGYEMGDVAPHPTPIALPGSWLVRYQRLFVFEHARQRIREYGRYEAKTPRALPAAETLPPIPTVSTLKSNMPRVSYEAIVAQTIEAIGRGDFYQANITRKFHGSLAESASPMALFSALAHASPAPYSACIRHGEVAILSSSPELFLNIQGESITTRPIKGSIRRSADAAEDAGLKETLRTSSKNLAENLMIVDLMRHDLAQVAQVGSVDVAERSAVYSYATIHHLISTIRAQKRAGVSDYDVVRTCFPPGSMTGAPKRAAIAWCAMQERMARGVYSGAIGWFGPQGCDLSVTIRTLLLNAEQFEFQVGGGIVAESTPADEWHETLVKARGIAAALGIAEDALARL